ncbi:YaiO family outer membrane beta-barrel protein [Tsuneonella sp. YG55]|uniref:YaiO family outer membrane beta-barrel protein n=1 Tax=Tsuneonella litorea TaxID=2976475 RepID=A0A9X2VZV7_9SPHN|nr:YaiO family outer membrane beta-barrel protein [Tsuneonella litorea]MCT2558432.1 YaiO family outer membrane beta-barrel protein [Tsuneonella litorea]
MTARLFTRALLAALALWTATAAAAASDRNEYETAVAARLDGRPEDARVLLEQWLAENPGDLDARLQLALADLALGRLDAAEAGFRAVLRTAPSYADAAAGLEQVRTRRLASGDAGEGASMTIEGAASVLTDGAADWSEAALDIALPVGSATAGGRLSHYRRFGLADVEMELRAGFHPTRDLWLRAHAGGTPKADFRPQFGIGGGFDLRLADDRSTVLTLDGAFQRYPLQDVVTINPGVVRYLAAGHTWITARGIGVVTDGGPLRAGALLRFDHEPRSRWRIYAGAANGPDVDLGVVSRTSALFGGIGAPLGARFSVGGSLSREWRAGASERTEFRLALKARL